MSSYVILDELKEEYPISKKHTLESFEMFFEELGSAQILEKYRRQS